MDEIKIKIDSFKERIIEDVIKMIKIKSIEEEPLEGMPFGIGCAEALKKILEIAENLGFKIVNMDNYIGYAEYGETEDYIAVLGHVDVVPEGNGWTVDPFGGEIKNNRIYGRGASDDKGPLISALYGLKAIVDNKLKMNKKVRIIFGTNEETGCKDVPYYLEREKNPEAGFTPDAEYPVINGEKSIMQVKIIVKDFEKEKLKKYGISLIVGGNAKNMVADSCSVEFIDAISKAEYIDKNIKTKAIIEKEKNIIYIGKGAHASIPFLGESAIKKFIEEYEIDNKVIKSIFCENNGESLFGKVYRDAESGELTLNAGLIHWDDKGLTFTIDIRVPVTIPLKKIEEELRVKIKEIDGIILEDHIIEGLYYDRKSKIIKTLSEVYKNVVKEKYYSEKDAIVIGGGTYAKSMKNIVAFGPVFPGQPELAHQADEYIEIEELLLNAEIYAKAIYELAK